MAQDKQAGGGGEKVPRGRRRTTPEKALAHPLRARLVSMMHARAATPAQLANELGEPLSLISYHVRFLAQAGVIELVDRTFKRGAVQHHYRVRDVGLVAEILSLPARAAEELSNRVRALIDDTQDADDDDERVDVVVLVHRTRPAA